MARHRQALEARAQWPEAAFWEWQAGHEWLRLLVFAVVFVFGIKGAVGAERLSEFFTECGWIGMRVVRRRR